ncbi:MAG: hypothetical protein R2860_15985 [Desulfobacterales bacterium]
MTTWGTSRRIVCLTYGLPWSFLVIATLVGLQLFRSITRPPMGLEKEALAIKQHDLTASFNTRSIFKEIDETAAAFFTDEDLIINQ